MSSHSTSSRSNAALPNQVVLEYLRKKGMGGAVLELSTKDETPSTPRQVLERSDDHYRNQRSILSRLTGGGLGYDRDGAWPVLHWGMPEIESGSAVKTIGMDEAGMLVESFISIQLRVLELSRSRKHGKDDNDLAGVVALLRKNKEEPVKAATVVQEMVASTGKLDDSTEDEFSASEKPELMAVTFALLVHTYCELLELGMEKTAHNLRDAFRSVYIPAYNEEYKDLSACDSTESMMRLNTHINQHLDSMSNVKQILAQIRQKELFGQELRSQAAAGKPPDPQQVKAVEDKIADLRQKHHDYSQKVAAVFSKKHEFPFLRRVRGTRWQLTISVQSFGVLQGICDAAMSTFLQTKMELHVERRAPLPFVPAVFNKDTKSSKEDVWNSLEMSSVVVEDPETNSQAKAIAQVALKSQKDRGERKRSASGQDTEKETKRTQRRANALEPSILLTTLASGSKGPFIQKRRSSDSSSTDVTSIWEEKGESICCTRMSPPDGNRIAGGCDDSLIRIWTRDAADVQVLAGHQNGFSVFGLDWNFDSRHLLSSGGDGVVRLWDTFANRDDRSLRGKDEAELAIFRGHAPGSSVWSVAFSPVGYYFVSTGSDSTGRIWTTDRQVPVRLLAGHATSNVNTAAWHPNGNYILTGADDKTGRLWDVQTGRAVRVLDGCHEAIHAVDISPNGRYAALADRNGSIYLWDLGSGKLMSELKAKDKVRKSFMANALRFSPCGEALASSGDDCCVRIWDVRNESLSAIQHPGVMKPVKSYSTKHTLVMDLRFTERNLLLGAGKSLTPVPKSNF